VRCAWDGGHNWLFNDAVANGGVVSDFLVQWTKPAHLGKGMSVHDELDTTSTTHSALEVTVVKTEDLTFKQYVETNNVYTLLPQAMTHDNAEAPQDGYYGNAASGCPEGSDIVLVGTGHACAPRIGVKGLMESIPVPDCVIGGSKGCPHYAGEAQPVCLAKGNASASTLRNPYLEGDFHCLLECPCEIVKEGVLKGRCASKGDTVCPRGATCELGELRHRAKGVCTYTKPCSLGGYGCGTQTDDGTQTLPVYLGVEVSNEVTSSSIDTTIIICMAAVIIVLLAVLIWMCVRKQTHAGTGESTLLRTMEPFEQYTTTSSGSDPHMHIRFRSVVQEYNPSSPRYNHLTC